MADFEVIFEEQLEFPPEYEDYVVGVRTKCNSGTNASQRLIRFNDIVTGDFVVGFNYNSPGGFSAQNLVIESYTDKYFVIEIATGIETADPTHIPNRLQYSGVNVTYPYTVGMSNLNNLGWFIRAAELQCGDTPGYTYKRERIITYHIVDSNGNIGPTRVAIFINTPQ